MKLETVVMNAGIAIMRAEPFRSENNTDGAEGRAGRAIGVTSEKKKWRSRSHGGTVKGNQYRRKA